MLTELLLVIVALHATSAQYNQPKYNQPEYNSAARPPIQDIGTIGGNSQFAIDNLINCPANSLKAARNVECNPLFRYRTINGICNNLKYPWWGAVGTPYNRLLEPQYDDVVNAPRRFSSVAGNFLPNARSLAKTLNSTQTMSSRSALLIFFGQFLAHDFAATATDESVECECGDREEAECFNIDVSKFNPKMPRECIEFRRDRDVDPEVFDCKLRTRNQFDDITHWLDASNIYGSDEETASELRTFKSGLLRSSVTPGSEFETLPIKDPTKCTLHRAEGCFFAGDERSEENIMLLTVHTHFLRYHNVLAIRYKELNEQLDDETIYQEVRRIVIGVYQNIIYSEWLPLVIGPELMDKYNLSPLRNGYLSEYDDYLFPNAFNEYVASAGRLHQNLPNDITQGKEDFDGSPKVLSTHKLFDLFFAAETSFNDFDRFAYGVLITPTKEQTSQGISESVNERLFDDVVLSISSNAAVAARNTSSLAALNIQRGRDHGIQSYNQYRVLAGLNFADLFNHLKGEMTAETIANLQSIYAHPDDIDLFYGGMSEEQVEGGIVGPTNGDIIARQYHNFKFADRFYYENGQDAATRFSLAQVNELRHARMASVMCVSLQSRFVPSSAFELYSERNAEKSCSEMYQIDLRLF